MRRALKRVAVSQPAQNKMRMHTFPAPVRGLVLNENVAAAQPGGARILDNWFPTVRGLRVRGGSLKYATVADGAPVASMFVYRSGGSETFFAATASSIFDITTVADADTIPSADITGQTSGYYAAAQFGTAGGDYLYAVNGDDEALLYDGTDWQAVNASSSPVSITGVLTSKFSHVWSYASRLFFVEKETQTAWFLPVDSLGGAATSISLAGIFKKGGVLLFGATWSLDAGDGLDDKCAFFSDQGEVAIYEGSDPSDANNWSKVGVYEITPPLGKNGKIQAGGDLLIATESGLVPLSSALTKDVAAISLASISRNVQPEWLTRVNERRTHPWEVLKWPSNSMMVVSLPRTSDSMEKYCLVANLETGAWTRFSGWDTQCMTLFGDTGYFGTRTGEVYIMERSGSDDGTPYVCAYVGQFDHLKTPGLTKTVHQARALYESEDPFNPRISASINYEVSLPTAPSSIADYTTGEWDNGLWDVAFWDESAPSLVDNKWVSIGKTGYTIAPQIQITCGVTPTPTIELLSIDVTYTVGGAVV